MIYRVVGESSEWVWSEDSSALEISLSPGRLMGAFNAGVADEAWGDLPMPMLSDPRVRFWFTERGWRGYGLRVVPPHLQHSATPAASTNAHHAWLTSPPDTAISVWPLADRYLTGRS